MRKHFAADNWFRCETCDHLFTVRVPSETYALEAHLPEPARRRAGL